MKKAEIKKYKVRYEKVLSKDKKNTKKEWKHFVKVGK